MLLLSRIALLGTAVVVAAATITSLPALWGDGFHGTMLRLHMMTSGAMVVAMPIFALIAFPQVISLGRSSLVHRCSFWLTIVLSFLATATVFLCMLPIPSTDQMEQLIHWHGYLGYGVAAGMMLATLTGWRRRVAAKSM